MKILLKLTYQTILGEITILWSFELCCGLKPANECPLTGWDKIGTLLRGSILPDVQSNNTISLLDSYFAPKIKCHPK